MCRGDAGSRKRAEPQPRGRATSRESLEQARYELGWDVRPLVLNADSCTVNAGSALGGYLDKDSPPAGECFTEFATMFSTDRRTIVPSNISWSSAKYSGVRDEHRRTPLRVPAISTGAMISDRIPSPSTNPGRFALLICAPGQMRLTSLEDAHRRTAVCDCQPMQAQAVLLAGQQRVACACGNERFAVGFVEKHVYFLRPERPGQHVSGLFETAGQITRANCHEPIETVKPNLRSRQWRCLQS